MLSQKHLETNSNTTNINTMIGHGFIYKLIPTCEHQEGDIYIGSTTTTIAKRFSDHKHNTSKKCSSKILFDKYGIENIAAELVEYFPSCSKKDLAIQEGLYQRKLACVNKNIAGRTQKEYRADHYESRIKEYQRQWREANREVTRAKARVTRAKLRAKRAANRAAGP